MNKRSLMLAGVLALLGLLIGVKSGADCAARLRKAFRRTDRLVGCSALIIGAPFRILHCGYAA
jgi:hypothetical protein